MNSSTTSVKSALIGIDDTEVAVRKVFLGFTEAYVALCCSSGYSVTVAAQGQLARNSGFFLPLRSGARPKGCPAKRSSEVHRPRPSR